MPLFFKPCFKLRRRKRKIRLSNIIQTYHDETKSLESNISDMSSTTINDTHEGDIHEEFSSLKSQVDECNESIAETKYSRLGCESNLNTYETSSSINLASDSSKEQGNSLSNIKTLLSYTILSTSSDNAEEGCASDILVCTEQNFGQVELEPESGKTVHIHCRQEESQSLDEKDSKKDVTNENNLLLKHLIETDIISIQITPTSTQTLPEDECLKTSMVINGSNEDIASKNRMEIVQVIPLNDSTAETTNIFRESQEMREVMLEGHVVDIASHKTNRSDMENRHMDDVKNNEESKTYYEDISQGHQVKADSEILSVNANPNGDSSINLSVHRTEKPQHSKEHDKVENLYAEDESDSELSKAVQYAAEFPFESDGEDFYEDCKDDLIHPENENGLERTESEYFDTSPGEMFRSMKITTDDFGQIYDDASNNAIQGSQQFQIVDNLIVNTECCGDFAVNITDSPIGKRINCRLAAKFQNDAIETPQDVSRSFENGGDNLANTVETLVSGATPKSDTQTTKAGQPPISPQVFSDSMSSIVGDLWKVKCQNILNSQFDQDLTGNVECCGDFASVVADSPTAKGISCRLSSVLENGMLQLDPNIPRTNDNQNYPVEPVYDGQTYSNRGRLSRNLFLSPLKPKNVSIDSKETNEQIESLGESLSSLCLENVHEVSEKDPKRIDCIDSRGQSLVEQHEEFIGLACATEEHNSNIKDIQSGPNCSFIEAVEEKFVEELNQGEEKTESVEKSQIDNVEGLAPVELIQKTASVERDCESTLSEEYDISFEKHRDFTINLDSLRMQIRKIISKAVNFVENGIVKDLDLREPAYQDVSSLDYQSKLSHNFNLLREAKLHSISIPCKEEISKQVLENNSSDPLMNDLYIYINDTDEAMKKRKNSSENLQLTDTLVFESTDNLPFVRENAICSSSSDSSSNSSKVDLDTYETTRSLKDIKCVSLSPFPLLLDAEYTKNNLNQCFKPSYSIKDPNEYMNFGDSYESKECKNRSTYHDTNNSESLPNEYSEQITELEDHEILSSSTEERELTTPHFVCPSSRPSEMGDICDSESEAEANVPTERKAAYGDSSIDNQHIYQLNTSRDPVVFEVNSAMEILPLEVRDHVVKDELVINLNPRKRNITVKCRGNVEIIPNARIQSASGSSHESIKAVCPSEHMKKNKSNTAYSDSKQHNSKNQNSEEETNRNEIAFLPDEKEIENARWRNLEMFHMRKAEALMPVKQPTRFLPVPKLETLDFNLKRREYQKSILEEMSNQLNKPLNPKKHAIDEKNLTTFLPSNTSSSRRRADADTIHAVSHSRRKSERQPMFSSSLQEKEFLFSPRSALYRTPTRNENLNGSKAIRSLKHTFRSISPESPEGNIRHQFIVPKFHLFYPPPTKSRNGDDRTPYCSLENTSFETRYSTSIDNEVTSTKLNSPALSTKFDTKFKRYAKRGRACGDLISYKNSTEWLRDAGIVGRVLSEEEADKAFKNIAGVKVTLNKCDYKRFLYKLSRLKKMSYNDLYKKLCEAAYYII